MQIIDVTKRRDDEVVIHYIDDDGNYQSLRAYPSAIIAWHHAAQQKDALDGLWDCANCDNRQIGSSFAECPNCETARQ